VECRLVTYIRPGIVGYGLTTYIRLRNEFCNTENGYNKIVSGLNSLPNFQMFHSCVCTQTLQEHSYLSSPHEPPPRTTTTDHISTSCFYFMIIHSRTPTSRNVLFMFRPSFLILKRYATKES
jgi:hypothetical protein